MASWVILTNSRSTANPYFVGLSLDDGQAAIPVSMSFASSTQAEAFINDVLVKAKYNVPTLISDADALRLVIDFLVELISRINNGLNINNIPVPKSLGTAVTQLGKILGEKGGKGGSSPTNTAD